MYKDLCDHLDAMNIKNIQVETKLVYKLKLKYTINFRISKAHERRLIAAG